VVAAPVNLEDVQNQLEDVDPVHLVVEGKLETSNEEDMEQRKKWSPIIYPYID